MMNKDDKMSECECTSTERKFLDILERNLAGPQIYIKREQSSVYETVRFTSFNMSITIEGHGGPEPSWVYKQPTVLADQLILVLEERKA